MIPVFMAFDVANEFVFLPESNGITYSHTPPDLIVIILDRGSIFSKNICVDSLSL